MKTKLCLFFAVVIAALFAAGNDVILPQFNNAGTATLERHLVPTPNGLFGFTSGTGTQSTPTVYGLGNGLAVSGGNLEMADGVTFSSLIVGGQAILGQFTFSGMPDTGSVSNGATAEVTDLEVFPSHGDSLSSYGGGGGYVAPVIDCNGQWLIY